CLLWMDVRAGAEAAEILATGDPALALNGAGAGPVSAEWMLPKALWLKRNHPELFAQADAICEYQDYLMRRLTGRRVASLTNVSLRWHYRNREGGWPLEALRKLGLESLLEKWPQEILAPGGVVGPLTQDAAAHLGLTTRTIVAQGGADAFIAMIGL